MPSEREALMMIEEMIGEELKQVELSEIMDLDIRNGYALDQNQNVVGLNLKKYKLTDITALVDLSNLTQLNLRINQITDVSVLEHLPHLLKLDLCGNLLADISMLNYIPNLMQLDLSHNKLTDISVLEYLHNLTQLDLSNNKLTDISVLEYLTNLTKLDLSDNKLSDISVLKHLTNLTVLSLCQNGITDIGFLKSLTLLTDLDIVMNKISDISVLCSLTNIRRLWIGDNNISDISCLENLLNLTELEVGWNRIKSFKSLYALPCLKKLDLSENRIKKIDKEFFQKPLEIVWEEGRYIDNHVNFYGNPIQSPPIEILKQGREAVLAYFASLEKEKRPLNEVRALLVGDGGAGKTTLAKRILGLPIKKKESPTHGINIYDWNFKVKKKDVRVRFWDFGGQEIMHATHQFFLSKRSLYVLVLDCRKDERTEYWLKHIESFGGDSPILVVLNKIDENPGFEVNRKQLQEKYPGIQGFFRLSVQQEYRRRRFQKGTEKRAAECGNARNRLAGNLV